MRLGTYILFLAVSQLLCGCESWPPYEEKAKENFLDNRESFNALEAKISATKYSSVALTAGDYASGTVEIDGRRSKEFIDDDSEWARLFRGAQVSKIVRNEESFVFVPTGPHSQSGRETAISYIHVIGEDSKLKECEPQFEDLECGVCGVRIDLDWWIDYMWYPYPILESEYQKYLDGQLPKEEYFELQSAAYRKCEIEGLRAIGYELE